MLYFRGDKLEFIDIEQQKHHQVTQIDAKAVTSYHWAENDQSFYYSMITDGISQIWQFDLLTRESKQITTFGGEKLLKNELDKLYYINDNFLYSLKGEYKQEITIPIPQCWCAFSLTSQYLFSTDGRATLSRMDVSNGEVTSTKLPFTHKGIKMIDNQTALTTKLKTKPTDIYRFSW